MNKILVEVSVGELLDKITILEIKKEKINDPEKLKFINDEHAILKYQLDQNVKSDQCDEAHQEVCSTLVHFSSDHCVAQPKKTNRCEI